MKPLSKKISDIINEWDPIEIFPMAPEDEYCEEIRKIQEYIEKSNELSMDKLAIKIKEIFIQSFGEDIFSKNLEECSMIANCIMH